MKIENRYEYFDFLVNFTEEDANGFIEYLDDKHINIEKEFFSSEESTDAKLFNLINQNLN